MNKSNLNKKIINNLILGGSLFGVFASIITQVQATSTPPKRKQDVHQYNKEATKQLKTLLARPETPLKECINLVQFQNADPNVQVGLFTLLEEVVLARSGLSVKPLIDKGADIHRVTGYKEVHKADPVGRTLLHLAVYPPPTARKLLLQHRQEKLQGKPQERPTREEAKKIALERELCNLPIDKYIERIHSENELLSPEYKTVKELLDNEPDRKGQLDQNWFHRSELNKEKIRMEETTGHSPDDAPYDIVESNLGKLSKPKSNSRFHPKVKEQYEKIKELFDETCGFTEGDGIKERRREENNRRNPGPLSGLMNSNKKDGFGPVDFSRVY
ncbi:MAG: hypothetical protein LBB05_01335 [Puniceicoccales bacterium]|jgi:hypothetical protein|nr:hypothetical protein [Puniceicoccales bacterium]